ncbi:Uma2 family endonuclease [Saccharopolyspora rosea]|uniref:Uma2 family endonuclease n=1 Tax=Saccharopolyspora rosea TaxID=524884 RepID=A0ABW3FL46_9PSEU|nr:Uma2 family endonuclease [Saccharopolyspora rosea]
MAAPAIEPNSSFDPLVELNGLWTPELADRYLPIPGMPPAKYECLDGKLIMSPREGTANMFAVWTLGKRLERAAAESGFLFYLTVSLQLDVKRWMEPDFAVLTRPGRGRTWIPANEALLVGECVSPSSERRDKIDKSALCAESAIPYFMRVEVSYTGQRVDVELLRLEDGEYKRQATARNGQTFETELPFPLSLDPAELLEP